jgi:hypothetical protein
MSYRLGLSKKPEYRVVSTNDASCRPRHPTSSSNRDLMLCRLHCRRCGFRPHVIERNSPLDYVPSEHDRVDLPNNSQNNKMNRRVALLSVDHRQ